MAGLYRQNNISSLREAGIDLGPRWEKILNFIVSNSSFSPEVEKAKQIQWWKTNKIGSVSVPGVLIVSGEPVYSFLKIQGSKPRTSEFDMISEFANQNESRVIRPPIIYQTFPWDEGRQFEAFIQEKLPTSYSIVNHPATDFELNRFFQLYEEYRANCRSAP